MYSNVQSIPHQLVGNVRLTPVEGENYILFINPTNWWDMVEIIDATSHRLSGQYV